MKYPEKEVNEMKASNLSDPEFKTIVIRMLEELKERTDILHEKLKR